MNTASFDSDRAAAVADLVSRYCARNPASERQFHAATDVLPGGNTRSVLFHEPFPLTMARGEGCWLWDADRHRYLDALGEFTAGLYGHSNPVIRTAIEAALAQGLSLSSHTAREVALAGEIRSRFPSMELLRFTNSGTEANLMALAAACAHTGRRKVLVFDGAYHGGVLSFGGGAASPVTVPHRFLIATYNDVDAVRAIVRRDGDSLAAILVEPMLGSGGCIAAEPAFLAGLRELAYESGALLIFDEVMTSRLSSGGRQALLGIKPDLTTLGKYFGGGLSFGAFGGRSDVMARFDPRRADALAHAGTFNNNVLTMAAGLAGLQQVLTPAALDALNARGDALREGLNALFARHGVALCCSGLGSMMNLHPVARPPRSTIELAGGDARASELLFFALLERGVFMARRGFIALSLPFGDAQVDQLVAALDDVLGAFRGCLPPRARVASVRHNARSTSRARERTMGSVGFIGASGLMGHGMARNLQAKGHELHLTVHRDRSRIADLLAAGAREQPTPAALAAACDTVFICVTGSPQVEQVVAGENGLLSKARRGSLIVDCSTSEPDSTARLRERCAGAGVSFVDAPLARTPVEAEAGKLNVMIGAEPAVFKQIEPLLKCFAENVFHVGGPGAGHIVKLLNNFIAQAICTASAEAFAVGQRAGIDPKRLVDVVSAGGVNSGLFQAMAKALSGDMAGIKFELDNARKDVRYYTHLAESLAVPTVVGEAVHQSLALASALGHGKKYLSGLVEAQEQITGAKLVPR